MPLPRVRNYEKLVVAFGPLFGASSRSKDATNGSPGIATRKKDAVRGSWLCYERSDRTRTERSFFHTSQARDLRRTGVRLRRRRHHPTLPWSRPTTPNHRPECWSLLPCQGQLWPGIQSTHSDPGPVDGKQLEWNGSWETLE